MLSQFKNLKNCGYVFSIFLNSENEYLVFNFKLYNTENCSKLMIIEKNRNLLISIISSKGVKYFKFFMISTRENSNINIW